MIAPIGAATFRDALEMGATVYHSLKSVLKKQGLATGLAMRALPNLPANVAALELISTAVQSTGLTLGSDIALALDAPAPSSSMPAPTRSRARRGPPTR